MRHLPLSLVVCSSIAFAQHENPPEPPLLAAQPRTESVAPAPSTALESIRGRLGVGYFGTDYVSVLAGQPTGSAELVHLIPLANMYGFNGYLRAPRVGFRRWSSVSAGLIQSVGVEVTLGTLVAVSSDQQTNAAPLETREMVGETTYTTTKRQELVQSGLSGGGVATSIGVPLALVSTTHVIVYVAPRATLRFASGTVTPALGSDAPNALSTSFAVGVGISGGIEVFLTALGLANWSVEGSLALAGSWTSLRLEAGNNVISSQKFRLETSFDSSPMDGVLGGLGLKYYF